MTKEEFVKKWGTQYEEGKNGWYELNNKTGKCLSDLNSLLKDELIKYVFYSNTFPNKKEAAYIVDKYLNEQNLRENQ